MVNEFYKILWITETIADRKFKVVSKNKYFRRKYKLMSNVYRVRVSDVNDVSDTFMNSKDQMKKKKTKAKR